MHEFNQSLKYDKRMHAADIRGSIAYAKTLTRVGILTLEEESKITQGLQAVGKEWATGVVCSRIFESPSRLQVDFSLVSLWPRTTTKIYILQMNDG
jgi:hypothetical protein